MKISQHHFNNNKWKEFSSGSQVIPENCQLVLAFGSSECIILGEVFTHIRNAYSNSSIVLASTAGEIIDTGVYDNSVVVTAIEFEKTPVRCIATNIKKHTNSYETGLFLMQQLFSDDLCSVFIISDGMHINGSELVAGFNENNPQHIPITGGLAGDAARFTKTYTGLNEIPEEGNVVAVGFYGKGLVIGHGSFGGWDEFGHERTITRSDKNVLYEIDGKNALDLYKEYLGDYVNELPASALLFPLSLRINGSADKLTRTILSINEVEKSMTFAGNLPEGSTVRLMKANFDKLIDASSIAANYSFKNIYDQQAELAILISCVGRKLILQERTDEEIQAARDVFGDNTVITGFYSYGEISPFNPSSKCELHNQTMTITTFSEI